MILLTLKMGSKKNIDSISRIAGGKVTISLWAYEIARSGRVSVIQDQDPYHQQILLILSILHCEF